MIDKKVGESRLSERKFIRYSEGAILYGINERKFANMAKDAGAIYKVDRVVLVNREIFERYLESFHI